jgi:hypothetical protein
MSSLDASQLKAAWEDAEHADPALRNLLKPFVWTEQETTARLWARQE